MEVSNMRSKLGWSGIVAGIIIFSLVLIPQVFAAWEELSLSVKPAMPGGNTTATIAIANVSDIESYNLELNFSSGTIIQLPTTGWFARKGYFPSSLFGASSVEMNKPLKSQMGKKVYLNGFKPTGSSGNVGVVTFKVNSQAANGNSQIISLSGNYYSKSEQKVKSFIPVSAVFTAGTSPNIALTPIAKDFGAVATGGKSKAQTFTLSNTGNAALTIGTISKQGANLTQFIKQNDNCSGKTIAVAGKCTFQAVFTPTSLNAKTASLNIPTDDPDTAYTTVNLEGTGATMYALTVNKTGKGTVKGTGLTCVGNTCSGEYVKDASVNLTATAAIGSRFGSWSGCNSADGNGCSVVMSSAKTVGAAFLLNKHVCATGCPYSTIQEAIDAAGLGDVINVAQGTYNENVVVNTSKEFALEGGFNSTFTAKAANPELTVISGDTTGDGLGDGSVLNISPGTGEIIDATVENFTLTDGNATNGGGVKLSATGGGNSELTLINNYITGNTATSGAGIYASSAGSGNATLDLINNMIVDNDGSSGGGISAYSTGLNSSTVVSATNNTIAGNTALSGGGVYAKALTSGNAQVTVTNDIIWGNTANSGDDIFIYQDVATTQVDASHSDIGQVTNSATYTGTYTKDGATISTDPIFVNPGGFDYHLNSNSPCKDKGTSTGTPDFDIEGDARPQGTGFDIGADEYKRQTFANVTLLSLTGGEVIPSGGYYNITWGAPAAAVKFNLWYSLDNGGTWKTIMTGFSGRSYQWTVPAVLNTKSTCRIKITGKDAGGIVVGTDISDGAYTIEP
jgi:hypothetical protein